MKVLSLYLLLLIVAAMIAINLPAVQTYIAQKAMAYLSEELHVKAHIDGVSLSLLNEVTLEGVYLEDNKQDTLLYAGFITGKITDWFIFKDANTISYLRLKDAVINMKRNDYDQDWNFQFIIDRFAQAKKEPKSAKPLPDLDIKELVLQNINFYRQDDTFGDHSRFLVGSIKVAAEKIDLPNKLIHIKKIGIDGFAYQLSKNTSTNSPIPKVPKGPVDFSKKTPFNPKGFDIKVDEVDMKQSGFSMDAVDYPVVSNQFDANHMDITDIMVKAKDIVIHMDTLRGRIDDLYAKDKSGIIVQKLSGDVKVSPRISEVSNMYLQTNRSVMKGYYAMQYKHFPAFNNYIKEVEMVSKLSQSHIAMEDIAYFAPALLRWKTKVYSGGFEGRGTVDHLDVRNIDLSDHNLHFTGDYEMIGLPDIHTSTLHFKNGTIRSHYDELIDLFPEIKRLDIEQLAKIRTVLFKGSVQGFYDRLTIDGALETNLGTLNAEKMALDYSGDFFKYDGQIQTDRLDLNTLFPDATLSDAAFKMQLAGNGFDYQRNDIKADGYIHHVGYNNYIYKDVAFDVNVKNGIVKAGVKSKDPNADLDLEAEITDLSTAKPQYQIDGVVNFIDFKKLGFVENSFNGKGVVSALITGTNFKNIEGTAKFKDMVLASGPDTLSYYDFEFRSYRDGLKNNVSFLTNNLKINVDGTFFIDDLASSVQRYLSHYMSGYIQPIQSDMPHQSFTFDIQAENPDELLSVFVPDLKISNGLQISGAMNTALQELSLEGTIPFIQYRKLKANNIKIQSTGDLTELVLSIHANQFMASDKEMISNFDFASSVTDNKILFDINTTSDNAFGTANINGTAVTENDSFTLRLSPSELFFNNQKWDISGDNKTVFAKGFMDIDNLTVSSDQQVIEINTDDVQFRKYGQVNAHVHKINIAPILGMVGMEGFDIGGQMDGSFTVDGLPHKMDADFNLRADKLTTNEKVMGDLILKGNYKVFESALRLDAPSGMYDEEGKIELVGTLVTDSAKNNNVDFRATGFNGSLIWAEPFAAELVKDLSGTLEGYIHIKGKFPKPEIEGVVNISQGHFTPLITGAEYLLPSASIKISSTLFEIKECDIYDKEANPGKLSGTIGHAYFSDLDFALRMVSEKIIVLDKPSKLGQNELFYGKVYAGVNLTLRGLLRDLTMNITARTTGDSKLYIPLVDATDLQQYEYITFKKKTDEVVTEKVEKKTRLTVNLDAIVTPELEAEIIIDPVAGDLINARGYGNLSMSIPSEGDIRLNGSYNIESGYYDFTFNQLQLLVYKNRFNLLQGSVINWDGKVSDATVAVKANTIKRARLYDLIVDDVLRGAVIMDNTSSERSDALTPQNIIIAMDMTGKLLSPDLKFQLDLEETRSIGTYAYQKMQRINQDDRDLVNQVVALLVLNQFMPSDGINSTVAVNTGVSNIADIVSTFASSQITNFTNKVLGIEDLWVNLKYKNYNLSEVSAIDNATSLNYLNRNEAGISVRKNFFNDRLVVDIGGVYDWGRGSYSSGGNATDNLTGDFRLAYLLTPDGRLRMNIFRTSSFDAISLQNIGRQGLGFAYKKNFSNFYDLFGIKTYTPIPPSIPAPPVKEILQPQQGIDSVQTIDTAKSAPVAYIYFKNKIYTP